MEIRAPPSLSWMAVGCVAVFTTVRYLRALHAADRKPKQVEEQEEEQRVATIEADASEVAQPAVEKDEESHALVDHLAEDAEPLEAATPVDEIVTDATEASAAASATTTTTTTVDAAVTAQEAVPEVVDALPVAEDPAPIATMESVAPVSTPVETPATVDNKFEPVVPTVSTPAASPPRPKRVCYVVMGDTSKCSDPELWSKRRFILQELANMHVPATELVLNDEVHWALTAKYKLHSGGSTQYPQIFLEYEGDDTNVRFIPHERFDKIVYHSSLTTKQLDDAKVAKKFRVHNTFRDVPKRRPGIFHGPPPIVHTTAVQQAIEIKLELRLRAKLTVDTKAQAAKAAKEADQKKMKEAESKAAACRHEKEEKTQEATTETADHIEAEKLEIFDILDVD